MKRIFFVTAVLMLAVQASSQPGFEDYHKRNDFLLASPGAMKLGLYGYDNPALLSYQQHPDIMFSWSGEYVGLNRRGLFIGLPSFGAWPATGLAVVNHSVGDHRVADYRLSAALGSGSFGIGAGYNFSFRDAEQFDRQNTFSVGTIYRPSTRLSIGFTGTTVSRFDHYEGAIDAAVRPFGNERLTLFGDLALRNNTGFSDARWSAGVVVKALPGTRVTGRYFNNNMMTFGIEFSLGNFSVSTQSGFRGGSGYSHNTYSIRYGSYETNLVDEKFMNPRNYAGIELNNPVRYQKYRHFDNANTLIEKLNLLEDLADSPRIGGVVINTSGMTINHTMLWELREQLGKLREKGKKVVVYIENAGINTYHFASVADLVVMHPMGTINLPGYVMGSIYLGDMLEKIGVGVKEFRMHEYKSGFETFSGNSMSDEDREQRQRLVDNRYGFVKEDIISGRGFTEDHYEMLVNEKFYFTSEMALEYGLADKLGRWDDINDILDEADGKEITILERDRLERFFQRSDYGWGARPRIAVIYAVGFTDMETGMRARSLARDISKARKDNNVKAIVVRVESPGGSVMAIDIIAEELRKARAEKPVVISHGSVAASGGYWISLYSDNIVTAPNTLTGSIGLISGWLYDDGLKDKVGYTTDQVKKGEFADLGFGVPLPLFNIPLMDRAFLEKEEEIIENMLTSSYNQFVDEVGRSRGKTYDEADALSRGRVWSGRDAVELGLADTLGGLKTAIAIAAEKAGFDIEDGYRVVEYPDPLLFSYSGLIAFLISRTFDMQNLTKSENELFGGYLQFLKRHFAQPLPLLPLQYMNFDYSDN